MITSYIIKYSNANSESTDNKMDQKNLLSVQIHSETSNANSEHDEVPFDELSGDEPIEKSFIKSTQGSGNRNKTNISFTSIGIMKSMMGFGILGLPNVVKNFGIVYTIMLLCLAFTSSNYCSRLMLKEKNLSRHSNYTSIGYFIFESKWIIVLMKLMIIVSNMGMMLGELIICATTSGNILHLYLEEIPWYLSRECFLIIIGLMLAPFMLVQKIEKLSFVNLTALLSLFCFCLFVVYNYFRSSDNPTFLWFPEEFDFIEAFRSLPTIILAFCWQYNLYPIFKGMKKPTDDNLMLSSYLGHLGAILLYMIVGILGQATYGNNVQTNYLKVIEAKDVGNTLYVILNLTFTLSTTLTQPLIFFGARNNFLALINTKTADIRGNNVDISDINNLRKQKKKRQLIINNCISLALFTLLIIAALYLQDLEVIFNFLGIICANAIQLVLPSLFYFTIISKLGRKRNKNYYISIFIFNIALLLVFVCVSSEFI